MTSTRKKSRVEQKRATRQKILEAARRLFATQGISATRTVDVAKAAGGLFGLVFTVDSREEAAISEIAAALSQK